MNLNPRRRAVWWTVAGSGREVTHGRKAAQDGGVYFRHEVPRFPRFRPDTRVIAA